MSNPNIQFEEEFPYEDIECDIDQDSRSSGAEYEKDENSFDGSHVDEPLFDRYIDPIPKATFEENLQLHTSQVTSAIVSLVNISIIQLHSSKNGIFSSSQALLPKPTRTHLSKREKNLIITCQATSIPAHDRVPDMGKRQLMNLLLLGVVSLPTAGMLIPYATFFAPPGSGGASGGIVAKGALGNDVIALNGSKPMALVTEP
ncbi:hypothetical protein L6164_008622 [Bauhinia variegata]|uniref:Uncharacterized protein n=1 Tax=Bauhinia variegata TaxID=167791 RepID=A0ACB9PGG5_BAUVA|nr:hypothetical protein L6164_008622 [Bauhinia variegata]